MSVEKKQMPATDEQVASVKQMLNTTRAPAWDHAISVTRVVVEALMLRLEQAEAKIASTEEQVVWGFYEEEHPSYAQGTKGHHELTSPMTAEEANGLIAKIKKLEEALKDALNEWEYAAQYKGDFLKAKHADLEQIAEHRKLLEKPHRGGADGEAVTAP